MRPEGYYTPPVEDIQHEDEHHHDDHGGDHQVDWLTVLPPGALMFGAVLVPFLPGSRRLGLHCCFNLIGIPSVGLL